MAKWGGSGLFSVLHFTMILPDWLLPISADSKLGVGCPGTLPGQSGKLGLVAFSPDLRKVRMVDRAGKRS